jgi:hypothetical protein
MTTTLAPRHEPPAAAPTQGALARKEIGRYARHPVFLIGVGLLALTTLHAPDRQESTLGILIFPAAAIGLFGLITMASLARSSDLVADTAGGAVATGQRARTLALVCALVVPFTAALVWYAWGVWGYHHWPPAANGGPFGPVGDAWAYSVLFALGVVPSIGGPILGLIIARWIPLRGAAPIAVVLLILVTIVTQGLIAPLRYFRLVMPWTQFEGPYGIKGDRNRELIFTGSPQWYIGYLVLLCAGGVLIALLRDDERPRGRLLAALGGVAVAALVVCVIAMNHGPQHTLVNPLHS